ncbi:MAG TPA: enoyl-CoA hydratase-related protein, partial [Thermoanaerobaculia bacterium]
VPFPRSAFEAFRLATPAPLVASLVMRARRLPVAEAAALGMIDELVPAERLLPRALEIAGEMAPRPSAAVATTKRQLRAGGLGAAEDDVAETFRQWNAPDARRRIHEFVESLRARRG